MYKNFLYMAVVAGTVLTSCQQQVTIPHEFTIRGEVPLPDGYEVGLVVQTDTANSVSIGEDVVIKDGTFVITGSIDAPVQGTLMTNNLRLVEQNGWPMDSIHWTYSEVFVSGGELECKHVPGRPLTSDASPFRLTGTQVQADYNDLLDAGGERNADLWAFIDAHPQSAVSVWLAQRLLQRAYRLTGEQVAHLERTITACPDDTAGLHRLRDLLPVAAETVPGKPVADLELLDTEGKIHRLTEVLPKGKYVLVDFWASWCGICIYWMDTVAQLAHDHADVLEVVSVSIDTDDAAWRDGMARKPEPWAQYVTTEKGYAELFATYRVGNGVPYYLLVGPDGKVVASPEDPVQAGKMIKNK